MRYKSVLALAVLAFLGAACDDETPVTGNALVAGAWQLSSGDNFKLSSASDLKYIAFDEAGTGMLVYQDTAQTDILRCADLQFTVVSDTNLLLTPQFETMGSPYFENQQQFTVSDTELTLSANGIEAVFTKVASIPAEFTCQKFSAVTLQKDLPTVYGVSGLAYDGTNLWYQSFNPGVGSGYALFPFDPATLAMGTPVDWPSGYRVHAFQGADVWAFNYSLNSNVVSRRTMADVENLSIDTTVAPFSYPFSIDAMAWDGTNLWFAGWGATAHEFAKVDVVAGTKLDTKLFPAGVSAFTWDGQYFWAVLDGPYIVGYPPILLYVPSIAKIDPATFKVVANYSIPAEANGLFPMWKGIAAVNGSLYLTGGSFWTWNKDQPGSGFMMKVTP